ncbi:hypothetical protein JW710_03990 [Candidatus Dojkabacteria bacterium]|nr:hypothetical protein [Candidatus Dojkabacteria bacterium]
METKTSETSGIWDSFNVDAMEISFVGAYDNEKDQFYSFWEKDLEKLEELMVGSETVVGYNSWLFDYGVLKRYFSVDPRTFPSIDLMIALKEALGFRPKLNDIAWVNVGSGKLGSGLDATDYWAKGEKDKLEKYCLEDVRLTYEVWKVGEETGKIKYYDKSGFEKEAEIDWNLGKMQKVVNSEQKRLI